MFDGDSSLMWPLMRLGEICSPKQHPTISSTELTDVGYPAFGANGQIGFCKTYTHDKTTIAITCRGATCGTVNVAPPYSYISGNAMALDNLDQNRVDLEFLVHALRFRGLLDVISGSAQPQITRAPLLDVQIPLPLLDEQRRIADVLRSIDDVSSESRLVLDQAENCLKELIDTVMRRGLGLSNGMGSDVPQTWRTGRCDSFFVLQRGFDITESHASPGPYRVISSSGPTYYHAKSAVTGPAIITGRKGRLGTVFYSEGPCWPHDTTLWVKDFKGNLPRFIYWKLRAMNLSAYDAATSVPTLNRNNVHALNISFPHLDEQHKIAELLDTSLNVIETHREHLNALNRLKDMAMTDLLSGRVRVPA